MFWWRVEAYLRRERKLVVVPEVAGEAGKKKATKKLLKELHSDPLWRSIGLLNIDEEDLSERDDWGVVKWESE